VHQDAPYRVHSVSYSRFSQQSGLHDAAVRGVQDCVRTLAPVLYLILTCVPLAGQPSAFDLYEKGRDAEKAGHLAEAYLAYAQAAALEPGNRTYWQRSRSLRLRALLEAGKPPSAADLAALPEAAAPIPQASDQDRMEARQLLPSVELKAEPFLLDFDLRGDSRKLFEEVAKAYGLGCVFDGEYQAVGPMRFAVTGMNYREALYALESATASFAVPLDGKTILVAKDTPQKRVQVEPAGAIAVPLPGLVATQDFNAVVTAVQQALALEKVSFDSQENTVIIRDRISKLLPARALLEDLLLQRGEVVIEMRLLEVSRNDTIEYGIEFPNLFSLTALTTALQNQVSLPSGLGGLLRFGGGKTLIGWGIMTPQLVATMSDSLGKVLLETQLPSVEGQPASMHIGERYPISTGTYAAVGSTGTSTGAVFVPPPIISYEDLGLSLKVTSRLHEGGDVTLDVDAEFKLLTGETVDAIPIIQNRSVKSTLRVAAGQWAMLAGLLNPSDTTTINGLAGGSGIPYLGDFTRTKKRTKSTGEVLILLRPRVVSLPAAEFPTRTYRLGSETRPMVPL
jgi:hypothetical protein